MKTLSRWDFPDTIDKADGYHTTQEPDLTRANFNILLDSHNELIEQFNRLVAITADINNGDDNNE